MSSTALLLILRVRSTVPILINFRATEIGAVQVDPLEMKQETWAVPLTHKNK